MGIADYLLVTLIGIGMIAAIKYIFKQKKAGKCVGCSGGCSSCNRMDKKH